MQIVPVRYLGTNNDDTVTGVNYTSNIFQNFGIGADTVVGGSLNDTFQLSADIYIDRIDGGGGEDTIDYRPSAQGLTINLANNVVTAVIAHNVVTVATLSSIEDVVGSQFGDFITGSASNNVISGGGGADTIDGGGGIDTASYALSAAPVAIDLRNAGSVQHGGDAEGDKLFSIEGVIGSAGADSIMGGFGGDNIIEGGGGADNLSAAEFDHLSFHADPNTVSYLHSSAAVTIDLSQVVQHGGDAEGDRLAVFDAIPSFDNVWGSQFNDQITGNRFNNVLDGEGGDDTFFHTLGGDTINGGAGSDTYVVGQLSGAQNNGSGVFIYLSNGAQVAFADGSHDVLNGIENLVGSQNADIFQVALNSGITSATIHGGAGGDVIYGGAGADFLYGDAGSDIISGGAGADYINGGVETDSAFSNSADYGNSPGGVKVTLQNLDAANNPIAGPGRGFNSDAQGDTLVNIQNINGSGFSDVLVGDAGANTLIGGGGDDQLIGGPGHDRLIGGPGDDILTGGNGPINWGGSPLRDPDTFEFDVGNNVTVNSAGSSSPAFQIGNDVITDFTPGVDTLLLYGLQASQGVLVVQHGVDAVMTIQNVEGSITLLKTHASDVHWTS